MALRQLSNTVVAINPLEISGHDTPLHFPAWLLPSSSDDLWLLPPQPLSERSRRRQEQVDFSHSGLLNPRAFINTKPDAIWGGPILQMEGKRKIGCLIFYDVLGFFSSANEPLMISTAVASVRARLGIDSINIIYFWTHSSSQLLTSFIERM